MYYYLQSKQPTGWLDATYILDTMNCNLGWSFKKLYAYNKIYEVYEIYSFKGYFLEFHLRLYFTTLVFYNSFCLIIICNDYFQTTTLTNSCSVLRTYFYFITVITGTYFESALHKPEITINTTAVITCKQKENNYFKLKSI